MEESVTVRTRTRIKAAGERGYALVLVVFMLALVVLTLMAALPETLTDARREKEIEMIWRGKQYARGVREFVRWNQAHGGGMAKFPTSMEDLTKNKVGIRFMRQAYKDPTNLKDGSWRLIYVGPNGQLIGSLRDKTLDANGNPVADPNAPSGQSVFGAFADGSILGGPSATVPGNITGPGGTTPNYPTGVSGNAFANGVNLLGPPPVAQTSQFSTPQAIVGSGGEVDIVGGNIIGVGGKTNKKSIIWFEKAKNYKQFEFIWDPSKQAANGAPAPGIPGAPVQNLNNSSFGTQGTNPSGTGFGTGFGNPIGGTSNPNPGTTQPQQQPQQ